MLTASVERRNDYLAFGDGTKDIEFEGPDLRRAFERVIAIPSRKLLFVIDSLDEFEGQSKAIIDFVKEGAQSNVKLCVASRPWLAFEDAFRRQPSLLMGDLTKNDICIYVSDHLHSNEHFLRLEAYEPEAASALIPTILAKASGVFLWVFLVVQSLFEGLFYADRSSDLQRHIDALPSDLEALFILILNRLPLDYFRQACETFRLMRASRETSSQIDMFSGEDPTLLAFYYADDENTKSGQSVVVGSVRADAANHHAEQMRRRINARCKGLLEVRKVQGGSWGALYDHRISLLHRTARDFIKSANYWPTVLRASDGESFDVYARWAKSNLWMLKVRPTATFDAERARVRRTWGIACALHVQRLTGIVQASYLDDIISTHETISGQFSPTFIYEQVVAYPTIVRYVTIVMSKMTLSTAIKYAKDIEKMLYDNRSMTKFTEARESAKDDFDLPRQWLKYYQHQPIWKTVLAKRKKPELPKHI